MSKADRIADRRAARRAKLDNHVAGISSILGSERTEADDPSRVNVTDLLSCIEGWGQHRLTALTYQAPPPVPLPPAPGPAPGPLPNDMYNPHDPVVLGDQSFIRSHIHINATEQQYAIEIPNNRWCPLIEISDSLIEADAYAAWLQTAYAKFMRTTFRSRGYYSVRGQATRYESSDCTYQGQHSWRMYNVRGGWCKRDVFDDESIRVGGGSANEWDGELPFGGTSEEPFLYERCIFKASVQMTIYDMDRWITYDTCDWTQCRKVRLELGARDIRFIDPHRHLSLTEQPGKCWLDAKGQSAAQLAARGILIQN